MRYEPYGATLMPPVQGPGYAGHVTDVVTGLSYMQQRYYDPIAGRFLSTDPLAASAASFNRYAYANNNPYKYIDPDGRRITALNEDQQKKIENLINSQTSRLLRSIDFVAP